MAREDSKRGPVRTNASDLRGRRISRASLVCVCSPACGLQTRRTREQTSELFNQTDKTRANSVLQFLVGARRGLEGGKQTRAMPPLPRPPLCTCCAPSFVRSVFGSKIVAFTTAAAATAAATTKDRAEETRVPEIKNLCGKSTFSNKFFE